ncbi:hypothetical protein ACHAXR_011125 [Thalassiosira sp. AJA248-18]
MSMSPTPKKKMRFVGPDDDDKATPSSLVLASVPEVTWLLVASFAAPPDVYNLALSSKHFHTASSSVANGGSKRPTRSAAAKPPPPVLATRLLRQSLLSSLGRVLEHSKSGITLEAALALPEGGLIAGSTMVQACLGRWNNSDVDVYCSAKAAPQVRSWLVEKANCMFVGLNDGYIDMVDKRLVYTVDTKIHHVEEWGSVFIQDEMEDVDAGIGHEALTKTEYYNEAVSWGKNCQSTYIDWKFKHGLAFDLLGVDNGKAYDVKPKPGGDLPFDFCGRGNIDLIVARVADPRAKRQTKKKSSKKGRGGGKEVTPFDLLGDFDLEICKASFDGQRFRIPDPHRTFQSRSTMEPNRRAVVSSYVKHFKPVKQYSLEPIAQSVHASSTIKAVRQDVPNAPFYSLLDIAESLPDRFDPGAMFGHGTFLGDPLVQAKYGAPIQFHNFTRKLINRLRKYQQRGIEVVDAPAVDNGIDYWEFCLRSF